MRNLLCTAALWAICLVPVSQGFGEDLGRKTVTQWAPYGEWSLNNPTWEGNPFDVVAWVTFRHEDSAETRRTQMFFDGDNTWKFRFCGTRLGRWTFTTSSDDQDLHGHRGSVVVTHNPSRTVRGFITHQGNRFARQTTSPDELEGFLPNTYMNEKTFGNPQGAGWIDIMPTLTDPKMFAAYMDEVVAHGCNGVFVHVNNQWFKAHVASHDGHDSENPDPETFRALERAIAAAHQRGLYVHVWAWGDEARKWTPIGVGGINGEPDRRVQRYIAARLAPLPGWVMGYGFDLKEWVSEEQIGSWAKYLHEHMGWRHLLWARELKHPELDAVSYPSYAVRGYQQIVKDLDSDKKRPHLYEERHTYLRNNALDMDGTRRFRWHMALAGGMMGFWGHYPTSYQPDRPYPQPQQLRTHAQFWQNHSRFLDLERANDLTDGLAMKTPDNKLFVFYKEETDSILMDLSALPTKGKAVAVDTTKPYDEIDLGLLEPGKQSLRLPRQSDWAIAVVAISGAR
ncbi:MAG: DUF5060 domain-containing protein [Planctomycetales bacterium]